MNRWIQGAARGGCPRLRHGRYRGVPGERKGGDGGTESGWRRSGTVSGPGCGGHWPGKRNRKTGNRSHQKHRRSRRKKRGPRIQRRNRKKNRRKRRRPDRQREHCRCCLWTGAHRAGIPFSQARRWTPPAQMAGESAVPQEPGPDYPAGGLRVPERGPAADRARKPGQPAAPPGDPPGQDPDCRRAFPIQRHPLRRAAG